MSQIREGHHFFEVGNGIPTHISKRGTIYTDRLTGTAYINKNNLSYWNTFTDAAITGGTSNPFIVSGSYSNGVTTLFDNSGGTITITGYFTGNTEVFVTGGTYTNGTATFRNNTGGTFSVTGFTSTDINVSAVTFDTNNTLHVVKNNGIEYTALINNLSGLTVNGSLKSGQGNTTNGSYSHAEGQNTTTMNQASHAEGASTIAGGWYSHAEGNSTNASGDSSHAEGVLTLSLAEGSHAEGINTISNGWYSHAEGRGTTTIADASHAEGIGTISDVIGQHVQGKFNLTGITNSLMVIGNGSSNASRSNLAVFYPTGVTFNQKISAPTISATTYLGLPVSSGSGLSIGAYITGSTSGSVLFVGSGNTLQQDNSKFFYDNVNKMLLLGTNTAATNSQLYLTDLIYARNVGDGDLSGYIFGLEYIWAFHKKMYDQSDPIIVLAGDSTTQGSTSNPAYAPDALVKQLMLENYIYQGQVYNDGVSGSNTDEWLNLCLPAQIARNPDLMIIRYGINDGANNRAGFESDLRAGLALIRASRNLSQTAIILMTPNSTNDTPNGRDEEWYLRINPIIRKAARDYNCVFIDTYTYFRDSTNAGPWMDNPYGDGRHIHPEYLENLWIYNLVGKVMFPNGFKRMIGSTNMENPSSGYRIPNSTDIGTTYVKGVSLYRATTGNGWPHDGQVVTFRQQDGVWFQINGSYTVPNGYSFRIGSAGLWGAWQHPFTNGDQFLGVNTGATPTWDTNLQANFYSPGSGAGIAVNGNGFARIYLRDEDGSANNKVFEILSDSEDLTISRITDVPARITYFTIKADGKIKINDYGSGSNTGIGNYSLQVDSTGTIIEAPSVNPLQLTAKTSNYTVLASEAGYYFTNEGAAGTISFTLPTAATNLIYTFINQTGNQLDIIAGS